MAFLAFLIKFETLVPLLLHFFPLAYGSFNTKRGNTDTSSVLKSGLVPQLLCLFWSHLALDNLLVALVPGFD